jgi:hypothetical protein
MELLTNATVVDDAIKFVTDSKEKLKLSNQKAIYNKNNESKEEPDYDQDKDQLEEEQEEQIGEATTINQVFRVKKYLDKIFYLVI